MFFDERKQRKVSWCLFCIPFTRRDKSNGGKIEKEEWRQFQSVDEKNRWLSMERQVAPSILTEEMRQIVTTKENYQNQDD